tara:strand:+ start:97470 stop:99380 length:1911 start_codon:yes stop_codon:yes gene_type:complete
MKNETFNEHDGITVIMPTYNQSSFICGAIKSLQSQTFEKWELLIINDGATDDTELTIMPFLKDKRIRYLVNPQNLGLGASLNIGLENASYPLIGYLPSDDIYFKDHLSSLFLKLKENPDTVLAYSGLKHYSINTHRDSMSMFSENQVEGLDVQLVQVLHKKNQDRWAERDQIVTSDLYEMFWQKMEAQGACVLTKQITCEWTNHLYQRHKIMLEEYGGSIFKFKAFYNIKQPISFQESTGHIIDEKKQFKIFQNLKSNHQEQPLKILLVGELAYNAERICALEEQGHKLYGLWLDTPYNYNTIGPLPFGNVEDIPMEGWEQKVNDIKPDIIYALLNFQAVPLAHEVLSKKMGIPFIWHFKEGPFFCRQRGTWEKLIDLFKHSDGQIFINPESRDWFAQYANQKNSDSTFILDGDLPSQKRFGQVRSNLLSDQDGEIHTLSSGRLIGLTPQNFKEMAEQKIHLHFYGDGYQEFYRHWIDAAKKLAPEYLHLHPNCTAENWVKEFSKYDAGWLHVFNSTNNGEIARASWSDLNYPARMSTLASAGVPMIQKDNNNHIAATQSLMKKLDAGVFFKEFKELGNILQNKPRMHEIRENVWENRGLFSFEYHVEDLLLFFRKVIENKKNVSKNYSNIITTSK